MKHHIQQNHGSDAEIARRTPTRSLIPEAHEVWKMSNLLFSPKWPMPKATPESQHLILWAIFPHSPKSIISVCQKPLKRCNHFFKNINTICCLKDSFSVCLFTQFNSKIVNAARSIDLARSSQKKIGITFHFFESLDWTLTFKVRPSRKTHQRLIFTIYSAGIFGFDTQYVCNSILSHFHISTVTRS